MQERVPQRRLAIAALERAARAAAVRRSAAIGARDSSRRARTRAGGTDPTESRSPLRAARGTIRNSSGVIVSRMSSCATSTFRIVRIRFSVCCARCDSSASSSAHDAIELVQQLLEPQLVDLVNDDEEHLVVLGPLGARLLQREQLVDLRGSCRRWRRGRRR